MYPPELTSPYRDRFDSAAAQRYAALGIEREHPERPRKIAALNSEAFVHRSCCSATWTGR